MVLYLNPAFQTNKDWWCALSPVTRAGGEPQQCSRAGSWWTVEVVISLAEVVVHVFTIACYCCWCWCCCWFCCYDVVIVVMTLFNMMQLAMIQLLCWTPAWWAPSAYPRLFILFYFILSTVHSKKGRGRWELSGVKQFVLFFLKN